MVRGLLYTRFFFAVTLFSQIRKYSSLVKAESKICENKNPRIAKIAQTRNLCDRKKNRYTVVVQKGKIKK